MVRELLSRIPIAKDALRYNLAGNPCWLIPIKADDSKIDKGSIFKIFTDIPVEDLNYLKKWYKTRMNRPTEKNPNIPLEYRDGKVLSVAFAPKIEMKRMQQGTNIRVVIIKYFMASEEKVGGNDPGNVEKK